MTGVFDWWKSKADHCICVTCQRMCLPRPLTIIHWSLTLCTDTKELICHQYVWISFVHTPEGPIWRNLESGTACYLEIRVLTQTFRHWVAVTSPNEAESGNTETLGRETLSQSCPRHSFLSIVPLWLPHCKPRKRKMRATQRRISLYLGRRGGPLPFDFPK